MLRLLTVLSISLIATHAVAASQAKITSKPDDAVHYTCDGMQPKDVFVSFAESNGSKTAVVSHDAVKKTFELQPASSGSKYANNKGESLWIHHDEALLKWDNAETEKTCQLVK